ncbi:hypothetical protein ACXR0O_02855 [Verrucomicrobiota bacterium sgz303538]
MPEAPRYIRNYEAVVSAFGRWPSFHDSPVLAFKHVDDHIALTVHVWEITSQVDERGYFVSDKHHIVRFAFHGVTRTDLEQFIPQNILFALEFSLCSEFDATGQFTVGLDSAMGGDLCGSFTATFGEVTDVVPCDKDDQPV